MIFSFCLLELAHSNWPAWWAKWNKRVRVNLKTWDYSAATLEKAISAHDRSAHSINLQFMWGEKEIKTGCFWSADLQEENVWWNDGDVGQQLPLISHSHPSCNSDYTSWMSTAYFEKLYIWYCVMFWHTSLSACITSNTHDMEILPCNCLRLCCCLCTLGAKLLILWTQGQLHCRRHD